METLTDVSSVYVDGRCEALRYKWIESERAQRDLGPEAMRQWIARHWHGWLRARWYEHIQGIRVWKEFDRRSYGLLEHKQFSNPRLLHSILDHLVTGRENLDVIQWAFRHKMPMDVVLEILEALDINSCRLACGYLESDGTFYHP